MQQARKGLILAVLIILSFDIKAQEVRVDSSAVDSLKQIEYLKSIIDTNKVQVNFNYLPTNSFEKTEDIDTKNIDARDFLRGFGRAYGLNIIVDNRLSKRITLSLSNVAIIEALIIICQDNDLSLVQSGQIFRVREYVASEPVPEVNEPEISFENGILNIELNNIDLGVFTKRLSQVTKQNIIVRNGVRGTVSGYLQNIEFETGLNTILSNNGFSLREKDGVYIVDRIGFRSNEVGGNTTSTFWVSIDEQNNISMDVVDASIVDIIREIGYQTDASMITYGLPENQITAKTNNLTIDQTLNYLFRGTSFTYRKEGEIYIIGDKATSGIASNKLIRLKHIRSDVVIELIPESVKQGASIQVVKEQNGLMVIGTNDIILELENFIDQIDYPSPQILIEALVVDVRTSDMYQLGLSLAQGAAPDSSYINNPFTAFFGQGSNQQGGFSAQGSGDDVNNAFSSGGNLFGIANLGKLPGDFFFRIQALDQDGIVNIRSRPQISTLNGYTASIEVGTTQYFLLTTTTPLQSPNQIVTQETQRFEEIEANVSLEITPYVSASGEVTAEIHPEFNTPVGGFNADVPPTINSRILDSTVRLKDGETIILGGLIQESETENINKVPILGSIPLLGRLFRNKSTSLVKSELVIFITPHVFYGDGTDESRWRELRKDLDLSIDKDN
ncbi:hypothetical protein A8B79_05885 [Balneola sp. EhC07]|uniref:type II secretion system protein GspD n=1 Tax=Balneola sp. EhC07 TaxID=1849360 RepID=UPI0007F35652|nr:type II secretion system protein GspD [Balneola sp. EhC07]OAN61005.1 hypothetical protein A8B79_05885 [Balneola sp. EhC07]